MSKKKKPVSKKPVSKKAKEESKSADPGEKVESLSKEIDKLEKSKEQIEAEMVEAEKIQKYCRRASDEGLKSQLKYQERKGLGDSPYAKELKAEIERRKK